MRAGCVGYDDILTVTVRSHLRVLPVDGSFDLGSFLGGAEVVHPGERIGGVLAVVRLATWEMPVRVGAPLGDRERVGREGIALSSSEDGYDAAPSRGRRVMSRSTFHA